MRATREMMAMMQEMMAAQEAARHAAHTAEQALANQMRQQIEARLAEREPPPTPVAATPKEETGQPANHWATPGS